MKRIKYTNTGIKPLCVSKISDKGYRITDATTNGILSINVIKLRNHSKNESAQCELYMDGKMYLFGASKDSLFVEISNAYLLWMLKYKNPKLFLKFSKTYEPPHFVIFVYVGKCVIHKLIKDGVII